jgi:hypothetical protein
MQASGMNNMSVPNMTTFVPWAGRFSYEYLDQLFAAHILGDIGSSYNVSALLDAPLDGTPLASNPASIWKATNHWEYTFLDSAPSLPIQGPSFLSIYSNRTVKSTAVCDTPAYQVALDGNNSQLAIVTPLNGGQAVIFPAIAIQQDAIYYLTTPLQDLPNSDGSGSCGPGCMNIKAIEARAGDPVVPVAAGSDSSYFYYDCNITVSSSPAGLPPRNAAMAAQAIALSGQLHEELYSHTNQGGNEYVAYQFGLPFGEPQNNSAIGMASLISRFAIGVVAAAAQTNPKMNITGGTPTQGVRLQ